MDFDAALSRPREERSCQHAIVNGRLCRAKHRRFEVVAQIWLEFARTVWTQWFRPQSQSMVQGDDRTHFLARLPRGQDLDRPFGTITNVQTRNFFDARNEFWIETHARFAERHERNHGGAFRSR